VKKQADQNLYGRPFVGAVQSTDFSRLLLKVRQKAKQPTKVGTLNGAHGGTPVQVLLFRCDNYIAALRI
jgi:uracil-DNA glycosylase